MSLSMAHPFFIHIDALRGIRANGRDHVRIELQRHKLRHERYITKQLCELAERLVFVPLFARSPRLVEFSTGQLQKWRSLSKTRCTRK